jgi:glucose/arabinose dehydrogenase
MQRDTRQQAAIVAILISLLALTACGEEAKHPVEAGMGENPELPPPHATIIPTVNIAPAKGWPANTKPIAATGLKVTLFADGLDHPRWIHVLPNGDVLVAETNAPERPEENRSVKGWIMKKVQAKAGAGTPSADRITLLRDADGDGIPETRTIFLEKLHSPFGMALVGENFYVANTDAVVRFPYTDGDTQITAGGIHVTDLPAGARNHHWTKNIVAAPDGAHLYATVGSNSNAAENGMDAEQGRAAIWEIDVATGAKREFATGLRNPNGMDWEPVSGKLWVVVNERDELGSDLVPDYMTAVKEGGFYGWPYSYYGQHIDTRATPPAPELVAKALQPDYALGPHTASLGLAFARPGNLPEKFKQGAFVGQHGSWNRNPASGYEVVFVPFADGKPQNRPMKVLSGFLDEQGQALGRPVGVAIDKHGALLVADDVGNKIWRVTGEDNGVAMGAGLSSPPATSPTP